MAALAYGAFNEQYREAGLRIRTPHTSTGIRKADVPAIIDAMGGHGVIKVPYANAGQGIYTITRQQELADFMAERHPYDRFIVQSLIGNPAWSSTTTVRIFWVDLVIFWLFFWGLVCHFWCFFGSIQVCFWMNFGSFLDHLCLFLYHFLIFLLRTDASTTWAQSLMNAAKLSSPTFA